MFDELLYLRVAQALARLRLPSEDAVLGDAFVEDMTRLLLAKGDEEHEIAWAERGLALISELYNTP